jgi:hypothetical protein
VLSTKTIKTKSGHLLTNKTKIPNKELRKRLVFVLLLVLHKKKKSDLKEEEDNNNNN